MTHPLVPQVIDLAAPVAQRLGLEVVDAVFQNQPIAPRCCGWMYAACTRKIPAWMTAKKMSQALEAVLDTADIIPDAYVLEISSPGISDQLTADRDFSVF